MKIKERNFKIVDIDAVICVEVVNKQKDIFDVLDEYIENLACDWCDGADDSFEILYKDGSYDYVNEDYDGHKIRRNNVLSMVYNNPCTAVVYGAFEISFFGVVGVAESENIEETNIEEI